MSDFHFYDHGSIVLLAPETQAAHEWTREHLGHATRYAGCVVIEPRYVGDILEGITNDGLTVI